MGESDQRQILRVIAKVDEKKRGGKIKDERRTRRSYCAPNKALHTPNNPAYYPSAESFPPDSESSFAPSPIPYQSSRPPHPSPVDMSIR